MINRQTALDILNANADSLPNLIEQAYQLRTKYKGNRVSIQLLTNVRSRNCTQNCAYCAQSRDSEAPIEKYRYVEDKKLYGDNRRRNAFGETLHRAQRHPICRRRYRKFTRAFAPRTLTKNESTT